MHITKSVWGWRYLAVGVLSCLMLAAVAGREHDPAFVTLVTAVLLGVYISIWELYAIMTGTASRMPVLAAAAVGIVVCILVLMAAAEALHTGSADLTSWRWTRFAFPGAAAIVLAGMLWKRRKE